MFMREIVLNLNYLNHMISISAFSVRNSVEDPLQNADTAAVLMEGGMDAGRAYQMAGHRVVVS